jgi:glycerol-3-phosphate acyltransferase PlsY
VATALGVLLGLDWVVGLATVATWLAVAFVTRYSSLSALIATGLAPVWVAWRFGSLEPAVACVVMTALLFWRHAGNIRRLAAGEEPKIGQK